MNGKYTLRTVLPGPDARYVFTWMTNIFQQINKGML